MLFLPTTLFLASQSPNIDGGRKETGRRKEKGGGGGRGPFLEGPLLSLPPIFCAKKRRRLRKTRKGNRGKDGSREGEREALL